MAIRIVTDSAADLLPEEGAAIGVRVIPLTVSFNGEEYYDSVNLTHEQFYEKLVESDVLPTTSQITPATFTEVFQEIIDAGDEVVAIILSATLSGTYQSACVAAENFPGRVHVINSETVCVTQRLVVQRAAQLVEQGLSVEELVAQIEKEKHEVKLLALLDTLEYLKKGGRISSAVAFAGGLLSIKPVVTVENGEVVLCGKARGSKNGNNLLRKMIDEGKGVDFDRPYCVAYSGLSDAYLRKYVADNADLWQAENRELPVVTVGCVVGTHVGPNAIAVAYFEKQD